MTKDRKDQQSRNRKHWEAHLKAAAKSGLSRAEYCRRHNLSYHAMGYWHKRLSRENDQQKFVSVKMALIQNKFIIDRKDFISRRIFS